MSENELPQEEKKEEGIEQEQPTQEVVDDRPVQNYKAELDRKNREIERLRAENETIKSSSVQKRDANDLNTWSDLELKTVVNSNDPTVLPYKDQAQDILFERKVQHIRERERLAEKRATSEMELRSKYPEALDPTSEFAYRVEQVMHDFELQKSPAGRLAAAKIVASELQKGTAKAEAQGRKSESDRVRDVKAQMVDGDRPNPTESDVISHKKEEDLIRKVNSKNLNEAGAAFGELLKNRGFSADKFFNK